MSPGAKIAALLALLVEQSGEQVSRERLSFMTQRLLELEPEKVAKALERLLESARRFPTLAEIKAAMGIADPQPKDWALLLSDKICQGIIKYGEVTAANTARALEHVMGEAAMSIVRRQGGWNACVDRANENLLVFKAQLRNLAESLISTAGMEMKPADRGELPPVTDLPLIAKTLDQPQLSAPEERPKLSLAARPPEIELSISLTGGDIVVKLGDRRWSPTGPLRLPTLQAPVTRRFATWRAAASWIADEIGEPHGQGMLSQLVAARRILDPDAELTNG